MLNSILGDMHPFVVVLLVIAFGFTMRRAAHRRWRGRRYDPIGEATRELATRQATSAAQLTKHEVELHDIARVAEAKLQTRLAVMDEMVSQADREIRRLESMLEEIRDIPTPRLAEFRTDNAVEDDAESFDNSPVEPDQFIRLLRQSGYNPQEIANATKRPLADIRRILGEPDDGQSEAA
ncbi:MAG: hypothetical protein O3B13_15860 [Planctomycetota bacterium]|nr:hypothetical protein [Planctomycetota bacterium]MDA1164567.1 hypothetical protein [Planctomycetota bacterium]